MGLWNKLFGKKQKEEEIEEEKKELVTESPEIPSEEVLEAEAKLEEAEAELEAAEEELDEAGENVEEAEEKFEVAETKLEEAIQELDQAEQEEEKEGFFEAWRKKLTKTRESLFSGMKHIFSSRKVIDEDMYEDLEELLVQSDIGLDMTRKIVEDLEKEVKKRKIKEASEVYDVLKEVMEAYLMESEEDFPKSSEGLQVILVVGVNGVGKTTTIGKMAAKFVKEGKKVVLGAGDTFRAAAVEQLEEWAKRSGSEIIKGKEGADPGAVVFDTLSYAQESGADIAIIDTAGRLHNKGYLMKELEKINNVVKKKIGDAYYESILVIDGTTGQNALNQAKEFNAVTRLTGFIITKLDGTAKGGIVFSVSESLQLPIQFIGLGEQIDDLQKFSKQKFIDALF